MRLFWTSLLSLLHLLLVWIFLQLFSNYCWWFPSSIVIKPQQSCCTGTFLVSLYGIPFGPGGDLLRVFLRTAVNSFHVGGLSSNSLTTFGYWYKSSGILISSSFLPSECKGNTQWDYQAEEMILYWSYTQKGRWWCLLDSTKLQSSGQDDAWKTKET